jgi:N-acetylmuramoyl-L-alanine amidase
VFDGTPVESSLVAFTPAPGGRGWQARFRPAAPLTDGVHSAEWAVRARDGGWSKTVRDTLDVQLPVARVTLEAEPPGEVAPGQVVALTMRALDRHGRPVADTLRASFASRVGAVVVDSLSRRSAAGPGVAHAYARVTGGALASLTARATPSASWVPPALAAQELTLPLVASGAAPAWRTGFTRGLDGAPVGGALVSYDTLRATTNGDGFFALKATPAYADSIVSARAAGYVAASGRPWQLAAIGGGALLGKRIALDPAGGGADTTGIDLSPDVLAALAGTSVGTAVAAALDTTRALVLDDSLAFAPGVAAGDSLARRRAQVIEADANLRVARALREYLEAAGATVLLTRDSPESLTAVDRLRRTEAFRPDRVLVISHRAPANSAGVGHYFSSAGGKAWAARMAARLRSRDVVGRAHVSESASYVVAQTAAVAASANLPDARPLYVERTRGAAKLRDEAYALYLALLEDFGSDPRTWQPVVATVVRADSSAAAAGGTPAAGIPVSLDGRWTLFTDAQGRVRFEGLPTSARVALEASAPAGAAGAGGRPTWVTTPAASDVRLTIAP